MTPASDFWWAVLASPLTLKLAAAALVALGVIAALLWVMARLERGRRRLSLWADCDGTATIEFALLLPILLFTILLLAQVTFLMGGNLFVHSSAFAACRSAIVQIPRDYIGEGANYISAAHGSPKYDTVYRAAVYALIPVAGEADGGSSLAGGSVAGGLSTFYAAYEQNPPAWIETRIARRVNYAAANTEITIERPFTPNEASVEFEPCSDFEPKDPVTVRVDHRLNLNIPYVRQIFADGGDAENGRYMHIMARATLTNEGLLDTLPPTPELPRRP